ncbi:MAG: class II aldolase/adducin family protein [Sphingomonadales bacterium]
MNQSVAISAEGEQKTVPVRDQVTPDEWQIRVDLAAAYRAVAMFGWDDLIFTHLSARIPGPDHHFLINPYGMLFEEVTASSLVKIDLNGKIILNTGFPVNAAGFTIHSAVHEAREDALCVMHVHTIAGTAVSAQEHGLLPLNQTAMLVRDQLAYHEYEGVALDVDERPRLVADLGYKPLMMLWIHGTLALGGSAAQAFTRLYYLERACAMQVATLAGNPALHSAPPGIEQKTAQQGAGPGLSMLADHLLWPAIMRKLDRLDPSFRD